MTRQVYAVVLAAGGATRFGGTKQLAETHGRPMVSRATEVATEVCGEHTIVVVGHESAAVAGACEGLPGFIVVNEDFTDGIGTSIAKAVNSIRHLADAVLITLADQPLVTKEHLEALIDSWSGASEEIIATAFSTTNGPPVLFASGCFEDLAGFRGDNGGRHLFSDSRFRLETIDFEPASVDIDTPEDLRRI